MLRVRTLFRALRKQVVFDLIHQLNPVYTGMSLAVIGHGIPIVLGPYVADWPHDPDAISARGQGLGSFARSLKQLLAYAQQRRADAHLLTTEEACKRISFAHRWVPPVYFVPHGMDAERFSPGEARQAGSTPHRTVILFYANVSERKGILDLLAAFDLLASRTANVELWIAGDGELLPGAKELAGQLHCHNRILFLGRQTQSEAVGILRQADIYCLPSHGEPYGMTVVEAMSCGLPVVVTEAGGLGCLVDDEGAIRVPMKAPQALAAALRQLVIDPERRMRMGRHNRSRVVNNFTWNRVIDRLEDVYRSVLAAKRPHESRAETASAALTEDLPNGGRLS
jgi:glycosyltransferase involved in cell wall biosynthesis